MSVTTLPSAEPTIDGHELLARPLWMERAICHGRTELFFAPHAERPPARLRREAAARLICMRCPVQLECRDHARVNLEYGMWGGESEVERSDEGYSVPSPVAGRIARAG